jgi:uncharacterized BrkB/YihY/UPF0761 family membrane protein
MNYKTLGAMLRQTFSARNEHEAPRLGAALAFYTILSLAPLVILVLGIVALIFGHSTAQNQLLSQVDSMVGHQGSEAVKGMIEHAQKPASGTVASIIGVITLLFGASGVFGELRSALNTMWDGLPFRGHHRMCAILYARANACAVAPEYGVSCISPEKPSFQTGVIAEGVQARPIFHGGT